MSYNLYQIHPANGRVVLLTTELVPPLKVNVEHDWLKRFEAGDIALVTASDEVDGWGAGDVIWSYTVHETKTKVLGR